MAEEKHQEQNENKSNQEQSHSAISSENKKTSHSEKKESHGGEITKDQVFPHLLSELGDHPSFNIWGYKVFDLPKIIVDNGVHIYSSPIAMEQAGLYTYKEHKVVRKDNGLPPALDMSVTNLICFQWIGMLLIIIMFWKAGSKYKKNPNKAPSGIQNLVEMVICFLRDDVVKPNIRSQKAGIYLFPYFIGLFFFILILNLLGLLPGGHTSTGALGVTAALAIISYFVINITAIKESGIGAWIKHLLGGAPWPLAFIMVPIEIISMFVKPFALTIRLFANMTAGHVVILSLVGLIFFFKLANGIGASIAVAPISVGFSIFMYFLETLVAVLQAYIFTILTVVFTGLAIGEHEHEHGEHVTEH